MKTALFYDTETTGFPTKQAIGHSSQPYIVQLAACLVDLESKDIISTIDVIIRPGVPIPEQTTAVHGINDDIAKRFGISAQRALHTFLSLWAKSDVRVAHNEQFDAKLIRIAIARSSKDNREISDKWIDGEAICTMQLANPLTALEGSIGNKSPNLSDACRILMDREIENAHSAMPDVLACIDLYFHCVEQEKAA